MQFERIEYNKNKQYPFHQWSGPSCPPLRWAGGHNISPLQTRDRIPFPWDFDFEFLWTHEWGRKREGWREISAFLQTKLQDQQSFCSAGVKMLMGSSHSRRWWSTSSVYLPPGLKCPCLYPMWLLYQKKKWSGPFLVMPAHHSMGTCNVYEDPIGPIRLS